MDKEPINGVVLEEAYQIVGVVILLFCLLPHNNSRNFIGDRIRKVKGAACNCTNANYPGKNTNKQLLHIFYLFIDVFFSRL